MQVRLMQALPVQSQRMSDSSDQHGLQPAEPVLHVHEERARVRHEARRRSRLPDGRPVHVPPVRAQAVCAESSRHKAEWPKMFRSQRMYIR